MVGSFLAPDGSARRSGHGAWEKADVDDRSAGPLRGMETEPAGRGAIPDELWSAAGELARRDGVNRTAAALQLDGGKLKRRMSAAGTKREKIPPPAFLELIAPQGIPAPVFNETRRVVFAGSSAHSRGATPYATMPPKQ